MKPKTLFGYPVEFSDRMPFPGNQGDLVLLPPSVTVTVTPVEMIAIRQALSATNVAEPEGAEAACKTVREIIGEKRYAVMESAQLNGQSVDVKVDWNARK